MSGPASGPELELVDDAYLAKMAAFESDCNDGKGEPAACHHVGEFYSVALTNNMQQVGVFCWGGGGVATGQPHRNGARGWGGGGGRRG